ncbi:MAG TPA: hypothetical protein VJ851_09570 [Jatrophihabitans sp.]|nr:hypothetical protein [Jatrophihabitans sp.]
MRASELIGRPVVDPAGRPLGIVIDLRCVQDGPLRGNMAAPRVNQLVVSPRRAGSMLGYHRPEQRGPWLIRAVVRWLHRNLRMIDWDDVEIDWNSGPIRLR